jgi:flavin-dependent dehydrogenase
VLFEGGYAGLSLVEGEVANLCLLVRRHRLAQVGHQWDGLLAALRLESPHLRERLGGGEPCWPRPLALSFIPYGYVRRRSDAVWYLGDQAAVIPSFAGDGMSIALHSAKVAAASYLGGRTADSFQQTLASDVARQVLLSTALSHGLVRRSGQWALSVAARTIPGLMTLVASRTRLPPALLGRS